MSKYHLNMETGVPGVCKAKPGNCPLAAAGDHFDSKNEAQNAFEERMANETFESTAVVKPSPHVVGGYLENNVTYDVDWDYDSYDCTDRDCGSDGDPCRDGAYSGLRVTGWATADGLYAYAKKVMGIPHKETLPDDLVEKLKVFEDFSLIEDDFDIYGEPDYYGDVARVDPPVKLTNFIKDYAYSKNNAVDKNEILPYLRGKKFDTTGLRPLEAIKESIERELGRMPIAVKNAKAFSVQQISVSKITVNKDRVEKSVEKPLTPVTDSGTSKTIAGVVVEKSNGTYELIDGYGRLKSLKNNNKQRSSYIILSSKYRSSTYGYPYTGDKNDWRRWSNE